ncbi:MAG: glycosyltransferase [Phycisphaera sp.]|nr:glycosyltransferase [Phycisphaera sp.]
MSTSVSVGVVVVTHRAREHLAHCLPKWVGSPIQPRVLVVNSSSNDGTVEEAQRLGAQTLVVPRKSFNHGSTRELARKHLGTDIVVMATPDAYAQSTDTLGLLVEPIIRGESAVAYARQVPREGADLFETFLRSFNYPESSHVRSLDDADSYGSYVTFCSDACCAWSNQVLDSVGGFPSTLTHEDAIALSRVLRKGHRVAYVAEAVVGHSHKQSLVKEFKRYFDTGLGRAAYRDDLNVAGGDGARGREYAGQLLRYVRHRKPALYPVAVAHLGAKWLGYKLGAASKGCPTWWKRALSTQDYFWTSEDYLAGKTGV